MRRRGFHTLISLSLIMSGIALQGCIHEYPSPIGGIIPGLGENPDAVNAFVDVDFDIKWDEIWHNVDLTTKAGHNGYRLVVEVSKDGVTVCHDTDFLSDDEFKNGSYRHRLSIPLATLDYQIAAWLDASADNSGHSFDADRLDNVRLVNYSTTDSTSFLCAAASGVLALGQLAGSGKTENITRQLTLKNPGARFKIVATDVQEFITDHKKALEQDDRFTVHLPMSAGGVFSTNLYTGEPLHNNQQQEFSGWMRLPFAEYTELAIANGFVFCNDASEMELQVKVTNSSLLTVSQTDFFSFPVKRGHLTIVRGDFLTHPIDGNFTINTVWDGEIYMEL